MLGQNIRKRGAEMGTHRAETSRATRPPFRIDANDYGVPAATSADQRAISAAGAAPCGGREGAHVAPSCEQRGGRTHSVLRSDDLLSRT